MKTIKYALIGILTLLINSCKYKCEGFQESELKWVPYEIGETIKYTDKFDTIEFRITDFFKTESSSFSGLVMDYECDSKCYYLTSKNDELGYQLREEYNDGFDWGMKIQITDNDRFEFDIPNNTSFSDSIKVVHKPDTLINCTEYTNVFIVSKDTLNKSPRIGYIIKAENFGIIEFYDFYLKQKWILINN